MYRHKVKRLLVVDDAGKLVGIVSRGDLLRPFLRTDRSIRDEIDGDMLGATLGIRPGTVKANVREGIVTLTGRVAERSLVPVIERLCRCVEGVVAVHQSFDYTYDDLGADLEPPRLPNRADRDRQATRG